jgi:hypothetical protein
MPADHPQPKAVWENQQAHIWLTSYSNAVACGGGKPGQGYVAVLQAIPITEDQMTEPMVFQESQSGTYLHQTAGTLRAGKDNFQGVIHPIAFNWQSGGDCRLNPSTEGTDALTVSQLPAVLVPTAYTVHGEHSSAMTSNGDADVAFPTEVARTIDTTGGFATNQGGTVVHDVRHDDQGDAVLPSSGPQDGASYTVGGERETYRWVVRKLTPLECERLMGWPDGYTAVGVTDEGEEITIAKTTRYKICGNGIVAPVTEWIGSRIMEVCNEE